MSDESDGDNTIYVENMRVQLSRFTHVASSSTATTSTRSSSNKLVDPTILPCADTANNATRIPSPTPASSPRKRLAVKADDSPGPSKKAKRGYATPETYAHLKPLGDYLKYGLNVVFCGINPGQMSSKSGHHFAHPTNHFWRCLHESGFTDRRLSPSEDSTLPDNYNIGLTNLVSRPSAEAAELSAAEMTSCVPDLLSKIYRFKPRAICFVGRVIWDKIESVLLKQAAATEETPLQSSSRKSNRHKSTFGLQPLKIIHPAGSQVNETLIYVVPSTSGLVRSYQLPDKIALFKSLLDALNQLSAGSLDTSQMIAIKAPAQ